MTKQQEIIKWIGQGAAEIGAVVTIERTEWGTAFVNVEADDAVMHLTVGKRGGYKFFYSHEPLGMNYTIKRGITQWRVWDFFKTVKRQRGIINEKAVA